MGKRKEKEKQKSRLNKKLNIYYEYNYIILNIVIFKCNQYDIFIRLYQDIDIQLFQDQKKYQNFENDV